MSIELETLVRNVMRFMATSSNKKKSEGKKEAKETSEPDRAQDQEGSSSRFTALA